MQKVKECKYLGTVLARQAWRDGRGNMREDVERQMCPRIICIDYKRKECIHKGKERVEKQYSPANTDI